MRWPFLSFTLALILGIIFAYYIKLNTQVFFISLILFLVFQVFLSIRNKKFSIISILLSLVLLGSIITNLRLNASKLINYIDKPVRLKGQVVDLVGSSKDESSYILLVKELYDKKAYKVSEKIILKIIGEGQLDLGEFISFRGVLREPLPNTNPKLYNHKIDLLTQGIYTRTTIRESSIETSYKGRLGPILKLRVGFLKRVENRFNKGLTKRNGSLIKSIILGKNRYLEEEDIETFRDLGLAHILAVSGLHIGILAGFFNLTFRKLGLGKELNVFLTLLILWGYALAIGALSSVLRANIMFSFLLISKVIHEPYDSINTLGLAAFILLIYNPLYIFSLGFQLSFLATFFLLYLGRRLRSLFSYSVSGILAVQIGLLPLQAYYFNKLPLLSFVANLLVVPIFSFTLMLSFLLLIFPSRLNYIIKAMGIIIDILLNLQFKFMEILYNFPILNIKIFSPNVLLIFFYYILVLIIFRVIRIDRINKKIIKSLTIYLLIIILINTVLIFNDKSIQVHFIDVGQGDSILIRSQRGNYLVDTGGTTFGKSYVGKNILIPYLHKKGIFRLRGVFISHFHGDHCEALLNLMDHVKIDKIYIGYKRPGNIYYDKILEKAWAKEIPIILLYMGDKVILDKNTSFTVLGPGEELLSKNLDDNDLSLVLMLNYFNRRILFTGDIEQIGERHLIKYVGEVDFLKVPHHGSNTSSSEKLLEKLRPKGAFVSLGRYNTFGHPHKDVVNRYKNKGIPLYRTDELGLINLVLNKEDYKITPYLQGKSSLLDLFIDFHLYIVCYLIYFIVLYYFIRIYNYLYWEMNKIEIQGFY